MIVDVYGNSLNKGDFVAYGVSSSSNSLGVAIVARVKENSKEINLFTTSRDDNTKIAYKLATVQLSNVLKIDPSFVGVGIVKKLQDKLNNYAPIKEMKRSPCTSCRRTVVVEKAYKCEDCRQLFHPVMCLGDNLGKKKWCASCKEPAPHTYKWRLAHGMLGAYIFN
jgi:hypothetical protein